MRSWWACTVFGCAALIACRDPAQPAASSPVPSKPADQRAATPPAAWGPLVDRDPALEPLELRRDSTAVPSGEGDRLAWTRARVGGPQAIAPLAALLEGEAKPTAGQLEALGLLEPPAGEPSQAGAWAELEDALWARLALTRDAKQTSALLFAVARLGGPRSQQRLAAELAGADVEQARARLGLEVMGMLCARKISATAQGLEAVAARLQADPPIARAAAYAVDRCAGPSAELLAGAVRGTLVERLTPRLTSDDTALARRSWKAIAGLGEVPPEVPTAVLSSAPPPWLVEVEAVRALVAHADGRTLAAERLVLQPSAAFTGPRLHVAREVLMGLRDAVLGSPELMTTLRPFVTAVAAERSGASGRRLKELALLDCEAKLLAAIGSGTLEGLLACDDSVPELPDTYADVLAVEAILRMGAAMSREDKAAALLERTSDTRSVVAAAALAALVDVDDPRISGVLRSALLREDTGVRAAAATAIATRSRDRSRRDVAAVPTLSQAAASWPNATMVEARIAVIDALGNLARSGSRNAEGDADAPWLREVVLPLAHDPAVAVRRAARAALQPNDELVAAFDLAAATPKSSPFEPTLQARADQRAGARGLRLKTSAGTMTIAFEGPAPYNQGTLASLAQEKFFDGLTLHRVVPGFVVQGGDPRGDGYGGPGFLVPCEWSPQHYERGVVGMALAGKDTGGSQFFIAQAREPRLDGRYTVIGRVTEGLDVLDALLPHDTIVSMEVIPADG